MFLKAQHGKRASELLAFAEQATEGDLRCLGRSQRYDEDDYNHWEWLRIEHDPNGRVHIGLFGWGSARGTVGERLLDLVRNPDEWHMGRQPFDPVRRLYGNFEVSN